MNFSSPKIIKYLTLILKTLVFIFLLWCIFLFIHWSYKLLTADIQVDYGEGEIVNFAYRISKGEMIYRNISNYPFLFCNYPPLFPWIYSLFMDEQISLLPARLISLFSLLIILIIIFKIVYLESSSIYLSLMASFLCIYFYPLFFWAPLCRIDIMATALSLTGFWFVIRYRDRPLQYLSVLFFLLALYTKQTLIAAPLAAYIYLILNNRKQGLISFAGLLISGGFIFALLTFLTDGAFYYNLIVYNSRGFFWERFFASWNSTVLPFYPVFWGLSLFFVCLKLLKNFKVQSALPLYFLFSIFITILSGGVGADLNMFIEFFIAVGITSALLLSHIEKEWKCNEKGLIILFCYFLIFSQFLARTDSLYPSPPSEEQIKQDNAMVEIFKTFPGDIIADNLTNILRAQKAVLLHPFVFNYLASSYWKKEIFIEDLEKGRFSIIQLPAGEENSYSPEFREILTKNYEPAFSFEYYHRYKGVVVEYIYMLKEGDKKN